MQDRAERHQIGSRFVQIGVSFFLYVLILAGVSLRLYRHPIYDMDSIQYMGNALLMEQTDKSPLLVQSAGIPAGVSFRVNLR